MRLALCTLILIAQAGMVAAGSKDTKAFVGLNWTFGSGGSGSEGVVGIARVNTRANGKAEGLKGSVHIGLQGQVSFDRAKLAYTTGKKGAMLEAGVGAGPDGVFGTAGAWAPHVQAGADIGLQGGIQGYLGLNTLDRWK